MTMTTPDRLTAYHEAGHAIAFALHRIRFEHVSIVSDESSFGRVRVFLRHYMGRDGLVKHYRPEALKLCSIAGPTAQAMASVLVMGDEPEAAVDTDWQIGRSSDCEMFAELPGSREPGPYILRAGDMLRTHWPAVSKLAELLLRRRRVAASGVRRILREFGGVRT